MARIFIPSWGFKCKLKNFFDCVRSRQKPIADVEQGHRASNVAHLANIAYKTGRKLQWNKQTELFTNDPDANKHLSQKPRKPWNLI